MPLVENMATIVVFALWLASFALGYIAHDWAEKVIGECMDAWSDGARNKLV